jgi:hypothetical protein
MMQEKMMYHLLLLWNRSKGCVPLFYHRNKKIPSFDGVYYHTVIYTAEKKISDCLNTVLCNNERLLIASTIKKLLLEIIM